MLDYEIVSALLCITCVVFMGARVNVRMQGESGDGALLRVHVSTSERADSTPPTRLSRPLTLARVHISK